MKNSIVNINDVEWLTEEHGNFSYQRKRLSGVVGGQQLGASIYRLMPGKKAFPYHFHYANEEAVFILEGSGTLRLNDKKLPIKQGDYVAFPVGPDHTHQIINTSELPLVLLCFSTMIYPDVVEYPDSNKIGATAGVEPGSNPLRAAMRMRFRKQDEVDYFEGEES